MSWPLIELGEIADLSWGNTSITKASYRSEGFDAYSAAGMDGKLEHFEFDQEGIVLSAIGARCGRCFWADGKWTAIKNTITIIPKNTNTTDARFLFHYLSRDEIWPKRGGAQSFIGLGDARLLKVSFPPLCEQRRIAAILDKADALRAKRREAIAKLDQLLKSIFLDVFGDPLLNPKCFPTRKLSDFYIKPHDGTKCGPFGSALKKEELTDDGIPVWNMDNIGMDGRMISPFRMWISESKYNELSMYSVQDGDIVISRAGTVGKMCVAHMYGQPAIISTNLIRLRLSSHLRPLYFVSLMLYCKDRVGRLKTGADGTFTHMNTGILDSLEFPYPPIELQDRFAMIVARYELIKARYQESLAKLVALSDSLSERAFGGHV